MEGNLLFQRHPDLLYWDRITQVTLEYNFWKRDFSKFKGLISISEAPMQMKGSVFQIGKVSIDYRHDLSANILKLLLCI